MSNPIIPVTVIVPCYRSGDTIERAVASIANQSFLPSQIILIDDASNDGTFQILLAIQSKYSNLNIIVNSLRENSGPGLARNLGWELADQPWLAFLDADDVWVREKLELQWSWILLHPEVVLVGGGTKQIDSDDLSKDECSHSVNATKITFFQMLISCRFYTRTVMLQKKLPYRFSDRSYTEDYLLWLEIILGGHEAYVIDQVLAYSYSPEYSLGSYSSMLWKHEKRELRAWYFLYSEKKISLISLLAALPWSYLKFLRRAVKRAL